MTKLDPFSVKHNSPVPRPDRVLVVDDSLGQRTLLSRILARSGLEVLTAESGEAAVKICETQKPDLIVCDWMMPGMSGLEFCETFRRKWGDRYSYFILLTSKEDKQDVAEGLDAGADDFLTKPVNPSELKARIRAGQRVLGMERELTSKNRLISATLDQLKDLHEKIDNDLIEAQKLQQSLVPERCGSLHGYDYALMLNSAGRVGGDLVGLFEVNENEFGLFSLDVSGHGIASALMTVRLVSYLSSGRSNTNLALTTRPDGTPAMRDPGETARRLNSIVINEIDSEHYLTLVLARIEVDSGRVTFVQAGHPHPAIHRSDGRVDFVGDGGLPIGLIPGAEFSTHEITLNKGDRLFISSDGITECMNPNGDLLEEAGLAALLQSHEAVAGQALFDCLLTELKDFSDKDDFDDDVSAVFLERQ